MKNHLIAWLALSTVATAFAQDGAKVLPANILPPKFTMSTPSALTNTAAPANSVPLGGYTLVSLTNEEGQLQPVMGKAPTLQFDGKRANGNDGCNRYGGAYVAREKYLRFGAMTSTMMSCQDNVMNQSMSYQRLLKEVRGYTIEGGTLTLLSGNVGKLVFRQQIGQGEVSGGGIKSNLNGTWKFDNTNASSMILNIKGSDISGNDGCNDFSGHVNFSGGVLKLVGPVAATRMACPPNTLSLYSMLGDGINPTQGVRYQVMGDTLTLMQGAVVWRFIKY